MLNFAALARSDRSGVFYFPNLRRPVLATPFIRANFKHDLAMIYSAGATNLQPSGAYTVMLRQLRQCAKNLLSCLLSAANHLFRRIMQPAPSNLVAGTLADLLRSRSKLLAENALLRQHLIVLHRQVKTPRLTWRERRSLLFLARWVPNWNQILQIIQPDTLMRWHREGFRRFWKLKSHVLVQTQPQRLAPETIALIERMAHENLLWRSEGIRGDLLKLNIKVAKRTIQKYMRGARSKPLSGQSWSTFLKTHWKDIWACDFVPVATLFFKMIHAFVIVHHESRRVVHFGVLDHPTDEWIIQQLPEATPFNEKPKYLICDNDKKYGTAESGEGDCVPGVERAATHLPSGCRLGQCWLKTRADERGSQHRRRSRPRQRHGPAAHAGLAHLGLRRPQERRRGRVRAAA